MNTPVIVAKDIRKIFNKAVALDAISFSIEKGQIFGFLGPSGSGKTTIISAGRAAGGSVVSYADVPVHRHGGAAAGLAE